MKLRGSNDEFMVLSVDKHSSLVLSAPFIRYYLVGHSPLALMQSLSAILARSFYLQTKTYSR
jgi:hypothetical protein